VVTIVTQCEDANRATARGGSGQEGRECAEAPTLFREAAIHIGEGTGTLHHVTLLARIVPNNLCLHLHFVNTTKYFLIAIHQLPWSNRCCPESNAGEICLKVAQTRCRGPTAIANWIRTIRRDVEVSVCRSTTQGETASYQSERIRQTNRRGFPTRPFWDEPSNFNYRIPPYESYQRPRQTETRITVFRQ
jgi:hypothetical protein